MNNRLSLRALEIDDEPLLYAIENDTTQWIISSSNIPFSHEFLRQYVITATGDIYIDRQVRLIITANEGQTPIGLADITSFDPKNNHAEIGMILLPEFRGKGYATEAVTLLLDYAKRHIHLHQLYAIVPASNSASIQMLLNAGFAIGMTIEDWLYDGEKYHEAKFLSKKL